jgi:predicted dehydrogenase
VFKVKIYGAGSIGNHLAHGCRSKEWDVLMCDINSEALKRTRHEIYPSRYGDWDPEIRLFSLDELPNEDFDLVIIGTPPDSHLNLAKEVLEETPPKVLLIEKPRRNPSLGWVQDIIE